MSTDVYTMPKNDLTDNQDLVALRTERIREFLVSALQEESPLRANLLAEAAGMMEMTMMLDQAIKQSLSDSPDVLKQFEKVAPVADAHLRYAKLSTRLIELEQQLSRSRKRSSSSR